jgi:uncharacterized protein
MLKKVFLIFAGFLSLSLGILGIFLPLLPTTPLLLLAAACFFRSSDKLYDWITHHKIFGKYILCYQKHRAVSKKSKIVTILLLWLTMSITVIFFIESLWIKLLLLLIALGVTVHVLKLRTLTDEILQIYD